MSDILQFDERKFAKARKAMIIGAFVIMVAITLLSCVSSYTIYLQGFTDIPWPFDCFLAMFAVIVVEGTFIWLVFGFTTSLIGHWERLFAFLGMWALMTTMLTNIVTHFMMVKKIPLSSIQQAWLAWGAVSVFIGVLVLVLGIRLVDPLVRFIRLELRFRGKQQEHIITARREGLDSQIVAEAMARRAELEAEGLAAKILGSGRPVQPAMIKGFSDGGESHSYGQKETQIIPIPPAKYQNGRGK